MKVGMASKFGAPDGLCIRAGAVLKGLAERGHEIHALTQSKTVAELPETQIHRFRAVQLNPHFSIDSLSSPKVIAKACQKHEIDVVHVQMNSGSTEFFLPYFKRALPPLVVTYHLAYAGGKSLYKTMFGVAWKASIFAAKNYDHVILVDPSQSPYFLEYGIPEDRMTVIKNGVDTELFRPVDARKENDDDVIDFVYVGRLSLDKGVNILLDAFQKYHCNNPKSRLTLIGDGMLKFQIEDCVDDGSVRWLGAIDHDRIPQVLQKMDVFVIPQNIGGLGLSVMEAMACGLPVITTAIGETVRLLSDDEGVLVSPHNVREVVDAMTFLSENEALRKSMGQQCRKKVVKNYSWAHQIENIEKVYQIAIESSKS
jgi:glycosyltransferase involved in cell wall biosynthesis